MARWIGNYGVVEELGKDDFGTLFRARNPILDVDVALKVLLPSFLNDYKFLSTLRQEAQLAADMEHPNLVPVHDFGELQDIIYIAHKFMLGGSLQDLLSSKGSLDEQTALTIFDQVGQGLDYAHSNGLLHLDINPKKILFDSDGVARLVGTGFSETLATTDTNTQNEQVQPGSSPAYMAPEVWFGAEVSSAADIYSMGCVLYEMLTGEPLFASNNLTKLKVSHLSVGPRFSATLPENLKPVLAKALAKEPHDRYQSMADFFAGLVQVVEGYQPGKTAITISPKINTFKTPSAVVPPPVRLTTATAPLVEPFPGKPATNSQKIDPHNISPVPKPWYAEILEETARESYEVEQEYQKRKVPAWMFLGAIAVALFLLVVFFAVTGRFSQVFGIKPAAVPIQATSTLEILVPPSPSPTPITPTVTQVPATITPTPLPVVVVPTGTPTPVVDKGIMNINANCRAKPGIQFFVIKVLKEQSEVIINGINEDGSWVNVKIEPETHAFISWDNCWVGAKNIDFENAALTRPVLTPIMIAKYRLDITLVGNKPANVANQYVEGIYYSYREASLKGEEECRWWRDNWNNQCTATIVTFYE